MSKVVKGYLQGQRGWSRVTEIVASDSRKTENKKPRLRKGPWMKNQRDSGNTRKAKIYQFTQKAYKHNKKTTINKIINGSLNNAEQVYLDIKDIEGIYVDRQEKGNVIDSTNVEYLNIQHSETYGKFTEHQIKACLKEINRNTTAAVDSIRTPDIRKIPTGHITAIINLWWGWI